MDGLEAGADNGADFSETLGGGVETTSDTKATLGDCSRTLLFLGINCFFWLVGNGKGKPPDYTCGCQDVARVNPDFLKVKGFQSLEAQQSL